MATTTPPFLERGSLNVVSKFLPGFFLSTSWMGKRPASLLVWALLAILAATSGLAGALTGLSVGVSWGCWRLPCEAMARNSSVSPALVGAG